MAAVCVMPRGSGLRTATPSKRAVSSGSYCILSRREGKQRQHSDFRQSHIIELHVTKGAPLWAVNERSRPSYMLEIGSRTRLSSPRLSKCDNGLMLEMLSSQVATSPVHFMRHTPGTVGDTGPPKYCSSAVLRFLSVEQYFSHKQHS